MRLAFLPFGALALGVTLSAQQPPVRDNSGSSTPTTTPPGLISGTIVTDEPTPQPMARATVTLSGEGPERTTLSDGMGRFAFSELPAGRYTLAAARPAYVRMAYGALRPGRSGTPLVIAAGQQVTGLTLRLPRGAVITGLVTDENGRPARGVSVRLMQFQQREGMRTLVTVSFAFAGSALVTMQTDDLGGYRLFGLPAGDYVLSASPQNIGGGIVVRPTAAPASPAMYVPVYYPGTTALSAASVIALAAGEERTAIDVSLVRVSAASISGVVTNPLGSARGGVVTLEPRDQYSATFGINAVTVGDDGRFVFSGVPPGDYGVRATMPATPGLSPVASQVSTPTSWGRTEITISGRDVRDVGVTLEPALTMTGRVIFDGGDPPDDMLSRLRISLRPEPSSGSPGTRSAEMLTAGRFRIAGVVPGAYRFIASVTPQDAQPWILASATAGGREAIDVPLEISAGENITDASITFMRTSQEVSGVLQNARGLPVTDYTLLVFSTDQNHWRTGARRIQIARPGTDGRFIVRGLPPGEYFIAALTDLDPSDTSDTSLLELVARSAVRFRLGPGEKKVQDFKVGTP